MGITLTKGWVGVCAIPFHIPRTCIPHTALPFRNFLLTVLGFPFYKEMYFIGMDLLHFTPQCHLRCNPVLNFPSLSQTHRHHTTHTYTSFPLSTDPTLYLGHFVLHVKRKSKCKQSETLTHTLWIVVYILTKVLVYGSWVPTLLGVLGAKKTLEKGWARVFIIHTVLSLSLK